MNNENGKIGALIKDRIKEMGLQQKVVASIARIAPANLNRMIKGVRPVDEISALKLQAAIGLDAGDLLRLQTEVQLVAAKKTFSEEAAIKEALGVYRLAPIQEMMNRGWIPQTDLLSPESVGKELEKFFQVDDLEQVRSKMAYAAKKTDENAPSTPEQLAWVGRARQLASVVDVSGEYNENSALRAVDQLRPLLTAPENAGKAVEILSANGIRLVFVEKLKSSKIDGACFWLDDQRPAVAMSLRFDRIDNFFFILRHELEHVSNGDGKEEATIDSVEAGEARANEAYLSFVDPNGLIAQNIAASNGYMTATSLTQLAKELNVHPGIVAGIIQHQTGRYFMFRQFLAKVRDFVLAQGRNVDGWGYEAIVF